MEVRDTRDRIVHDPQILSWAAVNREIIAVVQGQNDEGELVQVALNRLGELWILDETGQITRKHDASQLWVAAAYDAGWHIADGFATRQAIIVGGLLLWLLIVGIAWRVTKSALRPVHVMITQAEKIDSSKLSERLPEGPAEDELSNITKTVNKMLDQHSRGRYTRATVYGRRVARNAKSPGKNDRRN